MTTSALRSPAQVIGDRLIITVLLSLALGVMAGVLWLVAAVVSAAWLQWQVPLSAQDLAQASWLGSRTSALGLVLGTKAWVLGAGTLFVGIMMSLLRRSFQCISIATMLIGVTLVGGTESTAARIGILDETIKVGCFVETSKECLEMLGLPAENAKSRYNPDGTDAAWYVAARKAVVSQEQERRAVAGSLELAALYRAPLYIGSAKALKARLEEQRAAVAARRAALTSTN